MKQKMIIQITVGLLIAPLLSFGQYFQRLYDYDSSYDWGWNIFLQPDGNYFIEGGMQPSGSEDWGEFNMQLSADGNTILSKHLFQYNHTSLYDGNAGEMKAFTGGYLSPLQILQPHGIYPSGRAGLIKYNGSGDTVFMKTYTDTSNYFEVMLACDIMPNGDYLGGGGRSLDTPSLDFAYVIRTDSSGDTLWTRTYQKNDTQSAIVNNVIPLTDGRIVVGAMSTYMIMLGPPDYYTYYPNAPWFMILDGMGNTIRDTVFGNQFIGGGTIYKDMNGGYIHFGEYDSLYTSNPSDIENFPGYIAHLDTNFRITWITTFSYSVNYGHRDKEVIRQLHDSSYIVIGDAQTNYPPYSLGWAAKVSRTGEILWNHTYLSDTTQYAYFRDVVEKPDGGFVFVGKSFNDTCAAWKDGGDVWLVSVDSNGNLPPDTTTGVAPTVSSQGGEAMRIWPNPNEGSFMVHVSSTTNEPARVVITNMVGQRVQELTTATNKDTEIKLSAPPGVYFISAVSSAGQWSGKVVVQ